MEDFIRINQGAMLTGGTLLVLATVVAVIAHRHGDEETRKIVVALKWPTMAIIVLSVMACMALNAVTNDAPRSTVDKTMAQERAEKASTRE